MSGEARDALAVALVSALRSIEGTTRDDFWAGWDDSTAFARALADGAALPDGWVLARKQDAEALDADQYVTEFRLEWKCPQHGRCVGCDEARVAAARKATEALR